MKQYRYVTVLLIAIAFTIKSATGQQAFFEEQIFSSPTSEISLVNGIAADANNCIWLTTQSGIYRYDGTRFKHYSTNNTSALKFERMEGIHTILRGRKIDWCIRDSKRNMYRVDSSSQVGSLNFHNNPEIIFGYGNMQVLKDGKEQPLPVPKDSIYKIYYSKVKGQFYIHLLNETIASISYAQLLKGEKAFRIDTSFKLIKSDKVLAMGYALYSFSAKGLLKISDPSASPLPVSLEGDIRYLGDDIDYKKILPFSPIGNAAALAWYEGNIYELTESLQTNSIRTRLLAKGSRVNVPSFLYYSPAHQLLIGCFVNKGLALYKPKQFSLLSYSDSSSRLSINYYYVLLSTSNGYITANNSGIVWLGIDGTSRLLSPGRTSCYFLYRDKKGNIWYQKLDSEKEKGYIGYLEAGTYRQVIVFNNEKDAELAGMYQSDDSTYYVLTNRTFKKITYKGNAIATETILRTEKTADFSMLYAKNSTTLWIGFDQGLIEFNTVTNAKQPIKFLENANVRAVTRLAENNYLFGTYDKWIYQFKDGKWLRLFSSDKTVTASAHAFIIDTFSNSLWLSSNKGISKLPLQDVMEMDMSGTGEVYTEQFTVFGKDISVEFNGSSNVSSARMSDSSAAFANANGLVVFNPRQSLSPPLPKNVLVELINTVDSISGKKNNSNQLQFNVVVPYFGNPGNLEVLYKMTNTDDEWHRLMPNNIINYNNLEPGNHELQFRLRRYSDKRGTEVFITSSSFYIPYKWYQKTWLKVLAIAFIILSTVIIHNLRIRFLKRRKKELEQLIKFKTSELQETNENLVNVINELSLSESNLKESNFLKDEYYAVLTHDLRSPLKFLSFNISQLLELLPELSNETLKKGLIAAHQCSADVYKLIDEFVYWIQDNEKQLQPRPVSTLINAVFLDINKLYSISLESNKNILEIEIDPELKLVTDPKILFIIMRNAIDNANKYTTNGIIHVSATRQQDALHVVIKDNGKGMSEELATELTNLQFKDEQVSYKKRKTLGFYIMAMLTKKLDGSYAINSMKNEGTIVSFILPELGGAG